MKPNAQENMMHTESVAPGPDLRQLDADWARVVEALAQEDALREAYHQPSAQQARRQARRDGAQPPTHNQSPVSRAPRALARRDLRRTGADDELAHLDRAWALMEERLWIAERRRNRPRLSRRSAGAGGPRRAKLVRASRVTA